MSTPRARRTWSRQLLDAARVGDLARVEQALQNGANVEATNYGGCTPLHWACWGGHLDVVQYLLTSHAANLEATDNDGKTPLHFACEEGHLDVVQELAARGADLFVTDDYGKTPLHWAASEGYLAVVQYLLTSHGANLEATDDNGIDASSLGC